MKNTLTLIAIALAIGTAAIVGLSGGEEEAEAPNQTRRSRPKTQRQRGRSAAAPRTAVKIDWSGSAGPGGGTLNGPQGELQSHLQAYQTTFSKARAERVAATVRWQIARYRGPLLGILTNPKHPMLTAALDIARLIQDPALHPAIREIADVGATPHRVKAISAAHAIRPWTSLEFAEFFRDVEPEVIREALRCAKTSLPRDFPGDEIAILLGHPVKSVRDQALLAIPESLSGHMRATLVRNIDHGTELLARYSMRALARTRIDDDIEAALIERLSSSERATRITAMELLSMKREPIRNAHLVWSATLMGAMDDHEQARALYCLEQTKSVRPGALERQLPSMARLPRYFAARGLTSMGYRSGIATLMDLLDELTTATHDAPRTQNTKLVQSVESEDQMILRAVRRLLGNVSRLGEFASQEALRSWFQKLSRFSRREIAPPPFALR